MPDEPDPHVDAAYLALCEAAGKFDEDPYAVEALSLAALVLSGHKQGCDGCARELDPEPFAHAGMSWAEDRDPDGSVLIAICPICRHEAGETHYDPDGLPIHGPTREPLRPQA